MQAYNRIWRLFFALCLVLIAIQQFIVSGFRPVIMPPEPAFIGQSSFCMCVSGIMLVLVSAAIVSGINSRIVADYLGAFMLLIIVLIHIPYNIKTNFFTLAAWNDSLKLLALCGGAFVVATSLPATGNINGIDALMEKLRPAGLYFFGTTIAIFGFEHFYYAKYVALLVPTWLPLPMFWVYFTGLALVAAGAAILLKIKVKLAATLLGIALFLWLIMLHIPRALDKQIADNANEWTSVFEALGFCGIAFLIAGTYKTGEAEAVSNA